MDGGAWWAAVHGVAKSRIRLSDFTFTFHFHALEKEMATHSSVLAWRIPGTREPVGLPSMGSHRVGHNWSDLAAVAGLEGRREGNTEGWKLIAHVGTRFLLRMIQISWNYITMMVAQLCKYSKKIEFYCVNEPHGYVNYIWGKLKKDWGS